jgi:hypothetical protein
MADVANRMKKRGEEDGYDKAKREMTAPPEFYDALGEPRWYEIAMHCRNNQAQLRRDWDRNFVEDMPSKLVGYGRPTTNQAKQLLRIFVMLGGVVDPKVMKAFS